MASIKIPDEDNSINSSIVEEDYSIKAINHKENV
jgi:hypothetical protein